MHKFFGILISLTVSAGLLSGSVAVHAAGESVIDKTNTVLPSQHRPRIGLALGGGGSRGSGHVGVLKVLQEEHIPIDIIAGTSIGSVVGGFFANGMPLDDIANVFEKDEFIKEFMPVPQVLRVVISPIVAIQRLFGFKPYDGLYYGWKFRNYAQKITGHRAIEDLKLPYAAVVTDVVSGKSCRLTKGDLGTAMQASTAVPGLKKPVEIDNHLYCDGGLINNVPVNHAREMGADFVIAVNIDEGLPDVPLSTFRKIGSMERQALRIQLANGDLQSCQKADVFIQPELTGITLISRKKSDGQRGIEAGIKAARAAMPELKRKLAAIGVKNAAQNVSLN